MAQRIIAMHGPKKQDQHSGKNVSQICIASLYLGCPGKVSFITFHQGLHTLDELKDVTPLPHHLGNLVPQLMLVRMLPSWRQSLPPLTCTTPVFICAHPNGLSWLASHLSCLYLDQNMLKSNAGTGKAVMCMQNSCHQSL